MVMSISRRSEQFAADRKFTPDEAKALVDQVKSNGIVSANEKSQIRALLVKHKDIFQPGAAELLKSLIDPQLPPPPPADGRVLNLDPAGAHRPVFLNASGVFTANADGKPPANDIELGDAIFRAAELVDDAPGDKSPFATASAELRGKVLENLKAVLARVPADGQPAAGLDANQALQMRASATTTLLELMNASPEAALQGKVVNLKIDRISRLEPELD